ncbi:hypothetical protein ERX27_07270 [Macrococcus brunensis]|uniref:YdbS-like PH domain-containing protein n=1 Tax=Macrococcus brunensis TaxID=198483 RepID=A0A4R6BD69_9STAP|nr:PH domain-containing protein [Macrococcus brunensis]TDL96820.1 hypothetical protein ERX27_07270 [Macrococcus brunensis]ULG71659.1 PH domain-containing protein [Macrococcus brunensis]ULG73921.1 PH domain-containing protein [Macrococcus brunensis]
MRSTTEMIKQPLQVKQLKMYHYLIIAALLLLVAYGVHYGIIHWSWFDQLIFIYVLPALMFLFSLVAPAIRYRYTAYRLNAVSIEISQGLFWHQRSAIPMDRIQYVTISTGPIAQTLGLSKVNVITSGESVALPYVDAETARHISRQITERIKEVSSYV